jgi:hypothetical protein
LYGRGDVRASNTSATAVTRPYSGIAGAGPARRVARAVEALVVAQRDLRAGLQDRRLVLAQDLPADPRMAAA